MPKLTLLTMPFLNVIEIPIFVVKYDLLLSHNISFSWNKENQISHQKTYLFDNECGKGKEINVCFSIYVHL